MYSEKRENKQKRKEEKKENRRMKNNGVNFLIPSILLEGIYHLLRIYFYYMKKTRKKINNTSFHALRMKRNTV